MRVLLTFTGFHDPFAPGLVGDDQQTGPVLTLLDSGPFDRVVLFNTSKMTEVTEKTAQAASSRHPALEVVVKHLSFSDPTDYHSIITSLRSEFQKIRRDSDEYFIGISSGTPQMHACWILLAASGEIPAKILMTRPPQHVAVDRPLVKEVDLHSPEFPVIRSDFWRVEAQHQLGKNLFDAARELGIVGDHPSMQQALAASSALAASDAPVLILGETGTGKELFANLIHLCSERASKPFIPVNCASLPEQLVESMLFGHKRGAFTGASADVTGKFEQANDGTLFLDELGELPISVQAKLLRVIETGVIEPLGSSRPKQLNVRLVAATNRDLTKDMNEGKFREDLFYRLSMGEINLPSLRERKSDIPKIALSLLDRLNSKLKRGKHLSQSALIRLQGHSWPGNIRDLANVLERSVLLAPNDVLEPEDLLIKSSPRKKDFFASLPDPVDGFSLEKYLSSVRKQLILRALDIAAGNQSEASRLLGLTPQAVHKFLKSVDVA